MSAKLGIGMESFEEIREIGAYYVDKTELIFDLLENNTRKSKVTLFTRPRRFGKTLTMTMLRSFFDIKRDSHEAFAGLAVREYLKGFEGYKSVLGYGVAFYKKMALVKKLC